VPADARDVLFFASLLYEGSTICYAWVELPCVMVLAKDRMIQDTVYTYFELQSSYSSNAGPAEAYVSLGVAVAVIGDGFTSCIRVVV
jgi:hypothetical protein